MGTAGGPARGLAAEILALSLRKYVSLLVIYPILAIAAFSS